MKNLLNKKVQIDNFLTSDPYNKRGEIGTVISIDIIDEDNEEADVKIKFEDNVIGIYQYGTFDVL